MTKPIQQMVIYLPLNDLSWLPWLIVFITTAGLFILLMLFAIHRKNNHQRMLELEEKLHNHDALIFSRTEAQLDKFKKGMQKHLTEISDRISSNEQHTHRLINQYEHLKDALLSNIESDEFTDNQSNELK